MTDTLPPPPKRWASGPPAPPGLGHLPAFRRDRLAFVRRCVAEHGDAVVLRAAGRRVRLLAHPSAVHEVLTVHHAAFAKGPVLRRARTVLGEGLLTVDGPAHRRRRRLVSPAFSAARVNGYATEMTAAFDRLTGGWRDGEPVDVHAGIARATLDVAVRTLMGARTDVDMVESALADVLAAYDLALLPGGRLAERTPLPAARRLRRGRAVLHAIADALIADRRAAGGAGDLLGALLDAGDGDGLSPAELRDEVVTLLLAGHETTASTLSFACHLLAGHPDVAAAVRAEAAAALGGRAATVDDLAALPTTRALVAESLRLFPPSWAMARQAVADVDVAGLGVRAGDLVVLPQWAVHRDPRWWPAPDRPDVGRWLDGRADAAPRGAWFPFGGGPRQCVGERFAWVEAALGLATIAARWRLEPVAGRPLRLAPLITLRPAAGLWLRPRPVR